MTDKEIVERAKEAEKRTHFGKLVHSPISKGVNSAYGIGYIEGMVEYRNSLQKESVSEEFETALEKKIHEAQDWTYIEEEGGECPLNEEFGAYDLEEFARWGANWQKQQIDEYLKDMSNEIDLIGD